ncbi:hypothetical protein OHB06_48345 [Streptomyces sp. NBC_01604]|uniref:hypothetical protein n=1 Tax=Streptomyces sp. NBC_01604 TaxID=2975894 RepID=UPI00386C7F09
MTLASENRPSIAATVISLAAEATELETRVIALRQALAELDEQMRAVSNLRRHKGHSAVTSRTTIPDELSGVSGDCSAVSVPE